MNYCPQSTCTLYMYRRLIQLVIDFSDRLRELRLEKGYSQATLSQKITNLGQPLSEAALAKYES